MIHNKIQSLLTKKRCTLLGVGPMSANCVDAAIELSNVFDSTLMLIASRRQIDSEQFGGGYVNNWTTSEFAEYVIDRDKKGKILLARDHGGPWQSEFEKTKSSLRHAMESAKLSYKADIDSGFQILHIDPSIDIHGNPSRDRSSIEYMSCMNTAGLTLNVEAKTLSWKLALKNKVKHKYTI